MKIIVIGAGKVGYNLAESLSKENNDVVIIDKNPQALKKAEDNLDVMCIKGNGVSANTLKEAGIEKANLFIAVTSSDEINMVCCLTAKKLGAAHTIARIRNPEYVQELSLFKDELGLDIVINPEQAAAEEIARLFYFSPAKNMENFANGRVRMINLKVTAEMPIVGKKLAHMQRSSQFPVIIGVVVRDGEVIVPNGDFEIKENDEMYVIGNPSSVYNFCKISGKHPQKFKNIMILGGGRITVYLTKLLTDMGMNIKIIEIDKERCEELAEQLPNALIINADGTDEEVLTAEQINNMDGFIAITGMDEENLLSSLLAKRIGVKKVITKISRTNYNINIVKELGIDSVISPRLIVANQILKYVKGHNIESLYRIFEGQAEIFEFIAKESDKFLNIPLKKLKFPKDVIIATIVRKNEIVIPCGTDEIQKGDRVIVITKNTNITNLDELLASLTGGIQNELRNGIKKLGNIISL